MPTIAEPAEAVPIEVHGLSFEEILGTLREHGVKATPLAVIRAAIERGLGEEKTVELAAEARRRLAA